MWLEQKLRPGSTQFHLCTYYKMDFMPDKARFIKAVDWVFSHYDALYARMIQGADGVPEMVFNPENAVRCEEADLSTAANPETSFGEFLSTFARKNFVMTGGPLASTVFIDRGVAGSCFAILFHHIIVDGWGTGAVIGRVAEAYKAFGEGVEPEVKGRSFAEYVQGTKDGPGEVYRRKAREFWRALLTRPASALPGQHRTEEGLPSIETEMTYLHLPRKLADKLAEVAARNNGTLYHAIILAVHYLSSGMFRMDPLFMDLPVLNRGKEDKETIGIFVQSRSLPLPVDGNASVNENIGAIAKRVRDLFRHYQLTSGEIGGLYREAGHVGSPNSGIALSYITRDFGVEIDGHFVPLLIHPQSHQEKPLTLYVLDTYPERDIRIELLYQKRLFRADEANRFGERLLHVLEELTTSEERPLKQIDILPAPERRLIHSMLERGSEDDFPTKPIIHEIVERATVTPESFAVEEGERSVSYRECVDRASALARQLAEKHGIRSGDVVPLFLPRGVELIVAELAVMMTGAAFTPLEIGNPQLRLAQIAADCTPRCAITLRHLADKAQILSRELVYADEILADGRSFDPLAKPDDIAYIIYTSGSTGKPKGVEIPHKSLAQHLASVQREIPLRDGQERGLFFHSPSFDASIESIFQPLHTGGTIVTVPHPQWTVYEIARHLVEKRISFLYLPPAFFLELLKHLHDNPAEIRGHSLRTCIIGGDILHADTARLWDDLFGPSSRPVNIYGPTEITVDATSFTQPFGYKPDMGESIPIGHVYEGRTLRILDENGRDTPIGMEGELYIGGIGLARGYRNMPEETAKRFLTLEDGRRYYRSGDIVRLRGDGEIIFLRRADTQVKVRGYRIETSEVEACLGSAPEVAECAVVASKDSLSGECELKAFASLRPGANSGVARLRSYLEERLPRYMIPTITILETLPKSDGGKIHRKALLEYNSTPAKPEYGSSVADAPHGVVQEYLALLWEQALGRKVADTKKDFFELGGHSLLAAKLVATISKAFRTDFPFPAFFEKSSIAETEARLGQLIGDAAKVEKIAAVRLELARMSPEEIAARLAKIKDSQK
jgi:amino acid adenylation domain-containing protein